MVVFSFILDHAFALLFIKLFINTYQFYPVRHHRRHFQYFCTCLGFSFIFRLFCAKDNFLMLGSNMVL